MRLLLDTHAFIWWVAQDRRLSRRARRAIEDPSNNTYVSAVTAFEITTKHNVGRLAEADDIAPNVAAAIARNGFRELPITVDDGSRAGRLPTYHRDPFDRMLIAQAQIRDFTLVSNETLFDRYGVGRLW